MAFYRISEEEGKVTFELPRGNAIFHFIFFRIYSFFLIALGVFVFFFLKYESPHEPWMPYVGFLPVIPGLTMLFSPYIKSLSFTKDAIILVRNFFPGGALVTDIDKNQISTLSWIYRGGRYGGIRLYARHHNGKRTLLFRIPQLRLNQRQWHTDLANALEKTGYQISPPLNN